VFPVFNLYCMILYGAVYDIKATEMKAINSFFIYLYDQLGRTNKPAFYPN
jgi:hypothetical protein